MREQGDLRQSSMVEDVEAGMGPEKSIYQIDETSQHGMHG